MSSYHEELEAELDRRKRQREREDGIVDAVAWAWWCSNQYQYETWEYHLEQARKFLRGEEL